MSVEWLQQHSAADASPLEKAMIQSQREEARELAEEKRKQEEREAAREARIETMAFAEHQFGNPFGELSAARAAFAAADDVCRDLESQLQRAQAKRDRAQKNIEFFAQRAAQAQEMVSRAAPTDPVEAAVSRAHQEFLSVTRRRRAEMQTPAVFRSAVGAPKAGSRGCGCGVCEAYAAERAAGPGREITRYCSSDGMAMLGTLSGEIVR